MRCFCSCSRSLGLRNLAKVAEPCEANGSDAIERLSEQRTLDRFGSPANSGSFSSRWWAMTVDGNCGRTDDVHLRLDGVVVERLPEGLNVVEPALGVGRTQNDRGGRFVATWQQRPRHADADDDQEETCKEALHVVPRGYGAGPDVDAGSPARALPPVGKSIFENEMRCWAFIDNLKFRRIWRFGARFGSDPREAVETPANGSGHEAEHGVHQCDQPKTGRTDRNPVRKHSTRNLISLIRYLNPPRRLRCAVLERMRRRIFGIA